MADLTLTEWQKHVVAAIDAVRQAPYGAKVPLAVAEEMRAVLLAHKPAHGLLASGGVDPGGPFQLMGERASEQPARRAVLCANCGMPIGQHAEDGQCTSPGNDDLSPYWRPSIVGGA